jgi:hypothetical protein
VSTAARELTKHKLDLVAVQEITWDRGGTEPAGDYVSFHGNENDNYELGTRNFCV